MQGSLSAQQQRPESPTVTLTWHASKCKVMYLNWYQRYHLKKEKREKKKMPLSGMFTYISGTLDNAGVCVLQVRILF